MTQRTHKYKVKNRPGVLYGDRYKFFRKTYNIDISAGLYGTILKEFNKEVMKLIIYKNFQFELPGGMGMLSIKKAKSHPFEFNADGEIVKRNRPVNFPATKKLWDKDPKAKEAKKLVYYLNENTDGYIIGFKWDKNGKGFRWQRSYKFMASRWNKRWLGAVLKDDNIDVNYFEYDKKK